MRALHITEGTLYGGVEALLVTLARRRELCPAMETEFALCAEGRLYRELLASGAPVHRLGWVRLRNPVSIWRGRKRLRRLLYSARFDIAVCHHVWPQVIFGPAARAAGVPLAFWAHAPLCGRHWMERMARLTPPDLVIYASRFTAEAAPGLYRGIPGAVAYAMVAPPGGDPDNDRRAVRAELGTPAGAVVIIQTSRLEEWKGHLLQLEALSRLRGLDGWECWIVGGAQRPHEARHLARLEAIVAEANIQDRVRFLGQRADVRRLLNAADVHCQPNTGPEPFGVALVEALYARLPVVTTAMGGALEIVDDSCGMLVTPGDPDALAACLRRLITDPDYRRRLGAAGPARAKELCDPARRLQRLYEVLSRTAVKSAAPHAEPKPATLPCAFPD